MTTYTRRELRALEAEATAFAEAARPGRTYYIAEPGPESCMCKKTPRAILKEIVFERPSRSSRLLSGTDWPRWYGPHTAYDCYLKEGPVYADREHPAISDLPTRREHEQIEDALERNMLGGEHWAKEMSNAASGTRFRSTWGSKKR